jgi:putative membrane protein
MKIIHTGDWHMGKKEDSAMRILKERFAKGEITKEEFEKMKKDLMD